MLLIPLMSLLLVTLCQAVEDNAYTSFKNFPVVGRRHGLRRRQGVIPEQRQEPTQEVTSLLEDPEVLEEAPRETRQAELSSYQDADLESYSDDLDETFIEEAVFLSPSDRESRGADQDLLLYPGEENFEEFAEDESLVSDVEVEREERDHLPGGRGHHRAEHQDDQQLRGGRQTGAVAPALGVLNNPSDTSGNYNFNFANNDGTSRQESGSQGGIEGSYSFITPEGEEVSIQYVADETGFHATGSHVPQAPPMPPAIARMLKHLAKVNGKPILGY